MATQARVCIEHELFLLFLSSSIIYFYGLALVFPKWRRKYKNCIRNCLFTLVPVLGVLRAKSPASGAFLRRIISSGAGLWSQDTTALPQRKLKKKNAKSVRYSRLHCFVCLFLFLQRYFQVSRQMAKTSDCTFKIQSASRGNWLWI